MGKVYSKNPTLGYLNINSLKNKIANLKDVVAKVPINVLFIDETKLDDSFSNSQFLIENYQVPSFRRDSNSKGRDKIFHVRPISKRLKNIESNTTKTVKSGVYCLPIGIQILKKSISLSRY